MAERDTARQPVGERSQLHWVVCRPPGRPGSAWSQKADLEQTVSQISDRGPKTGPADRFDQVRTNGSRTVCPMEHPAGDNLTDKSGAAGANSRVRQSRADTGRPPFAAHSSRFGANGTKPLFMGLNRAFTAPFAQDQLFETMRGSPVFRIPHSSRESRATTERAARVAARQIDQSSPTLLTYFSGET